uniref:TIL domain-containing protein n=1 Tax=Panagrolaimus davidi TaxID=227884 RepID=A0A914PK94_9BILA
MTAFWRPIEIAYNAKLIFWFGLPWALMTYLNSIMEACLALDRCITFYQIISRPLSATAGPFASTLIYLSNTICVGIYSLLELCKVKYSFITKITVNAQICPLNENWSLCAPACQATCSQLLPICPLPCLPGCVCNLGFVRNDLSRICVPLLQCLTPGGLPLLG